MYFSNILTSLVALAVLDIAAAIPQGQNGNNGNNNNNNGQTNNGNDCNTASTGNTGNNNAAAATALDSANIQQASDSNGNPSNGQAASLTDPANFINFCSGKTITNGQQITGGSCNGIVMGDMPSQNNMVSSIIINPAPGDNIDADTTFKVQFQTSNLVAGTFTNPDDTYYAAPQQLQGGKVIGHSHVTIQSLGNSLTPNTPPDPTQFAFFLGIDDAGNGDGLLSATVTGGLPAGNYRVCTLTSSSNHQPVLMPVAKRGAQDDCTKFTVGGNNNANNNNANNNNNAGTQQQGNNNQGNTNNAGNQQQGSNNQKGAATAQSSATATQNGASSSQTGSTNSNGSASQDCNNQQGNNNQKGAATKQSGATATQTSAANGQTGSANSNGATGQDCNNQQGNQNQNQNQQQRGSSSRGAGMRQRFSAREFIS